MTRSPMFDRVIALYPRWWRDVYGSEVRHLTEDLVADGQSARRLTVNLVSGAVRARLWARGMPMRPDLWAVRSRLSIALATLPWLAVLPFLAAGLHGSTAYILFHGPDSLRRAHAVADETGMSALGYLYDVLGYGMTVGMVAAVVGWGALSQAAARSRRARRLVNVPLYFLPLVVGLYVGRVSELDRAWTSHGVGPPVPLNPNGPWAGPLLVALWIVFVMALVATSVALLTVARDQEIPPRAIKRGRQVATVVALALCCMAVCAIAGAALSGSHGVVQGVSYSSVTFHIRTASVTVRRYDWLALSAPLAVAATVPIAGWFVSRHAVRNLSTFFFRF